MSQGEQRVVGLPQLFFGVIKLVALLLVAATPLVAVWVASSLAAHENGSLAIAFIVGVLLFPVGPSLWELWAGGKPRKSRLIDRLILRSLFFSVLFLGGVLGTRPQLAFVALSTRGDWFLEGHSGPGVERVRAIVFAAAAKLEWLYLAAHKNPYKEPPPKKDDLGNPVPTPTPTPPVEPHPQPPTRNDPTAPHWPLPTTLHPIVGAIPASAETSIGSVGFYIAEHVRDPGERIKALHDYVVDRVAYNVPALAEGRVTFEDRDAETVFRTHVGVCAGYAGLLAALGKVTGDEIVYVHGDARVDEKEDQGGASHAWNAAKLDGKWYLVDPTWDAGYAVNGRFEKHYSTNYLFTTPEIFSLDHFPAEERWQLRERPISRGEFMRQPRMSAQFYADGFELVAPDRSQVTVDRAFEAQVRSKNGRFMLADFVPKLGGDPTRCTVDGSGTFTIRCEPAQAGEYSVRLFSGAEKYTTYHSVGSIDVNRR
jgi:transglutaminase-like putative cysteine protease